jgi:hypothetical protein
MRPVWDPAATRHPHTEIRRPASSPSAQRFGPPAIPSASSGFQGFSTRHTACPCASTNRDKLQVSAYVQHSNRFPALSPQRLQRFFFPPTNPVRNRCHTKVQNSGCKIKSLILPQLHGQLPSALRARAYIPGAQSTVHTQTQGELSADRLFPLPCTPIKNPVVRPFRRLKQWHSFFAYPFTEQLAPAPECECRSSDP